MIFYGVSKDSCTQIKISSEKKVKEQERSVVDKGIIKYAWEALSKNGKHAESLMIYLMFAFELTPRDVRLLKFEDIKMKISKLLLLYIDQRIIVDNKYLSQNHLTKE